MTARRKSSGRRKKRKSLLEWLIAVFPLSFRGIRETATKIKVKGGGQECPPYTCNLARGPALAGGLKILSDPRGPPTSRKRREKWGTHRVIHPLFRRGHWRVARFSRGSVCEFNTRGCPISRVFCEKWVFDSGTETFHAALGRTFICMISQSLILTGSVSPYAYARKLLQRH